MRYALLCSHAVLARLAGSGLLHQRQPAGPAPDAAAVLPAVQPAISWSYAQHGADWIQGSCQSRTAQSPVDFEALNIVPTGELVYNYPVLNASEIEFVAAGHGIELTHPDMQVGGVLVDGEVYNLFHIDLHSPAEHTVRGVRPDLEIQLFHKAPGTSRIVVVSFLVAAMNPARDNAGNILPPPAAIYSAPAEVELDFNAKIQPLVAKQPPSALGEKTTGEGMFDVSALFDLVMVVPPPTTTPPPPPFPEPPTPPPSTNAMWGGFLQQQPPTTPPPGIVTETTRTFWQYDGSQTAPPCDEGTRWFVARESIRASAGQMRSLQHASIIMSNGAGTYRLPMPWNTRKPVVLRSTKADLVEPEFKRLRSGPIPRTDDELFASAAAKKAIKLAKQVEEYTHEMDERMQAAATAHHRSMLKAAKVEELSRMEAADAHSLVQPQPADQIPPVVQEHFAHLVPGILENAKQTLVKGLHDIAQEAASRVTGAVRAEADRQVLLPTAMPTVAP